MTGWTSQETILQREQLCGGGLQLWTPHKIVEWISFIDLDKNDRFKSARQMFLFFVGAVTYRFIVKYEVLSNLHKRLKW